MKKFSTLLILLFAVTTAAFAQSSPKLSYQAIVRNTNNRLVQDSTFTIEVQVLQNSMVKYTETRTVTSSHNGMIAYQIGEATGRTAFTGSLNDVTDWSDITFSHIYHLSGGNVSINEPVTAVPFALQTTDSHTHANKATLDRTEQAYRTADSTKLAGIEALAEVNVNADWNATSGDAQILNRPRLDTMASVDNLNALAGRVTTAEAEIDDLQANYVTTDTKQTISGVKYFTDTVKVPSGFTFGTTTSANCNNVAVNACDLLTVFDSLQREIASLRARLDALHPTLTLSPDRNSDMIRLCGNSSVAVTYTATVENGTATSYTWSTSGGTPTSSTTNTYTVTYTTTGSYTVSCTANGADISTTKSVIIAEGGTIPTLGLCEDCNAGSITLKSGDCTSLTWVNNDDATKTGTVPSIPADSIVLRMGTDSPTGVYTFTGTNSDGCTTTRTATLGRTNVHPCTVTIKNSNEMGSTATTIDSVKDHQDNWYRVVQIGEGTNAQCWLAENMRATTEPGGTNILQNPAQSNSSYSAPYAYYPDNSEPNSHKYGCLYTFPAAMNITDESTSFTHPHRGICPEGWHIPTDEEWNTLATNAGCTAQYDSGTGLGKLTGGCDWTSYGSGTDSYPGNYSYSDRDNSGFSALPAGYCYGSNFDNVGNYAFFWSASSSGTNSAYYRFFNYSYQYVGRHDFNRYFGFSVRCLRDVTSVTMSSVTKTDSTGSTLSISAAYTATQTVTGSTICAYTDAACTTAAGTCAADVAYSTSPITGTVTGLTPSTQYYVKVTATTAGSSESKIAGPFSTKSVMDTISFVANGGAGTMAKQVVNRGTVVAIRTNTFTHTGNWEFTGWNDACDGNGITYADAANITTSGNVTLYAQWHTFCTVNARNTNYENGTSNTRVDSVKDHQDNWYRVVQIGFQCWLAENMRATTEPNSPTNIVQAITPSSSYSEPMAYRPDNSTTYSDKYGILYNFPAAMNISTQATSFTYPHRGICPEGWHIPQQSEWCAMLNSAGTSCDSNTGIGKLTSGCDWPSMGGSTSSYPGSYSYAERNSSGFSVLPAGNYAESDPNNFSVGHFSGFWSSTPEDDGNYAVNFNFYYIYEYVDQYDDHLRSSGYSVRCVRDISTD